MASPMLERDDLSVYVVAGVPKSFKKRLSKFVDTESRAEGEIMLLDDEITEWLVARLRGEKARSHEETPASSALWRAFRALSAARYHVQEDGELEARIRTLRTEVEAMWMLTRPRAAVADSEEEEDAEGEEKSEGTEASGADDGDADDGDSDDGDPDETTPKTGAVAED